MTLCAYDHVTFGRDEGFARRAMSKPAHSEHWRSSGRQRTAGEPIIEHTTEPACARCLDLAHQRVVVVTGQRGVGHDIRRRRIGGDATWQGRPRIGPGKRGVEGR